MIRDIEPICYQAGMKPNDFWNCTYREASLFVNSYIKEKEINFKSQVLLLEKATDKIILMGETIKKPKYTKIIDSYKDLFKEEYEKIAKEGNISILSEEDKKKYVLELQDELERGDEVSH